MQGQRLVTSCPRTNNQGFDTPFLTDALSCRKWAPGQPGNGLVGPTTEQNSKLVVRHSEVQALPLHQ